VEASQVKKTLAAVVALSSLALAQPRAPKFPEPNILLDSKAVSIGVVQARPDDVGFKELFKTAWDAIKNRTGSSGSFLDLISAFLSRSTQENILLGFLPFQGVRIDHFDEQDENQSSFMVTFGGFHGLQGLFYNTLLSGPDGKAYPTEKVSGETVVVRQKPGQPREKATTVARVDGTFYSFADLATAKRVLANNPADNPDLTRILKTVDATKDTYGAVNNRKDALLRFLDWINRRDFRAVQQAVGEEKLRKTFDSVVFLTWQGDLISDDRMDMQVRFRTTGPEQAEILEDVLTTSREALAARGRMGDWQMTTVDADVLIDIQFTGYRKMLTDYLGKA
jgi:hypothetical protein